MISRAMGHIKLALLAAIILAMPRVATAQVTFKNAMESGLFYEQRRMTGQAANSYRDAFKRAETDAQRAEALLGEGRNTPLRYGQPDPATDGKYRFDTYGKLLALPAAPAAARAEAYLALGQTYAALAQSEVALDNWKKIRDIPDASASQKLLGELWSGELLIKNKKYEDARARLLPLTTLATASVDEVVAARQLIMRSHVLQINMVAARAELAKINAIPGLADDKRADLYLANGDIFAELQHYEMARNQYEAIAVLPDASSDKNVNARYKIGQQFMAEKNYKQAIDVWTALAATRGAEKYLANIWQSIGIANLGNKNYDAAREAYSKWQNVPGLEIAQQVLVWQHIADSFVQEKQYAQAREALGHISTLVPPGNRAIEVKQLRLRQLLDVAEVYQAEEDFKNTAATYLAILAEVPVTTGEALFNYEVRDSVWASAEKLAKLGPSMDAAYSIFEQFEKLYPYEFNDAKAYLAMGDIAVAQGKFPDARAKFEKVRQIRKNYDEARIAEAKLTALEKLDGTRPKANP